MSTKRQERIELLRAVEQIVNENIVTDRDLIDRNIRQKNRTFKTVLKELEEWRGNLETTQRLLESENRMNSKKRKDAEYAT